MDRETETIQLMIELYCKNHHSRAAICEDCKKLADYAAQRIEKCPFGVDKPTCSDCTVHCFKPEMRRQIIAVMRYAGPRMTWRHPLLALKHLQRKLKNRPSRS